MPSTRSDRGRRLVVGSVVLAAVAAAAAGCSGSTGSRIPPVTLPTTAAPTTPAVTTDFTAPSLPPTSSEPDTSAPVSKTSGSYLKTLLPGTADEQLLGLGPTLPPGWTANTGREQDSGAAPTAPAASLVAGSCDYLAAKSLDLAGGLSIATASEPLSFGDSGIGLSFYAYKPGDAAKSFDQVRKDVTSSCATFSAILTAGTVEVNVSATPVSGLGDEALLVKTVPQGPYLSQEDLMVRRGDVIMSMWLAGNGDSMPDLTTAAAVLVAGMG